MVALTGLPIGYSVIVALTGLPIGYNVIVALTGLPVGYSVMVALTGLPTIQCIMITYIILYRVSIKKRFIVATSMMLVIFLITTAFVKVSTKNCKLDK